MILNLLGEALLKRVNDKMSLIPLLKEEAEEKEKIADKAQ